MSDGFVQALLDKRPILRRRRLVWRLKYLAWRRNATINVDIPRGVSVGKRISIELARKSTNTLSFASGARIGDDVLLRLHGGEIRLGDGVDVRSRVVLNIGGGTLVLDGPNNLGWGTVVHCAESVHLERFCHAGEYVTVVDSSHFYTGPDDWSYRNSRTAPISLGVDVWLCPRSTITSGVTIGDHTIVASNSVVVKDMPGGALVSGVPAKVVRELDLPWRESAVH